MLSPLLTASEAAERLGISERSLKDLLRSGALRAAKVGKARNSAWRISEDALEAYFSSLEDQQQKAIA